MDLFLLEHSPRQLARREIAALLEGARDGLLGRRKRPSAQRADFGLGEDGTSCEDFQGTPVSGATGYYVGEFNWADNGEDVTGYEAWVLYANDEWERVDDEARDCYILWTVTGEKQGQPQGCASCDFSLALHMTFDRATSTSLWVFQDNVLVTP